jgi:fimbrial isopeptide formation D2 family protein/LPXTG-motif cell wall-anchored protein
MVLAVMMIVGTMGMALAAAGDLTVDPTVTVTGFQSGDTVTAYQFITWDATNNQWAVADGVGLTLDQITDGLDKAELATLASHIDKMTVVTGTTTGATWEKTCGTVATAGSYLILVTSDHTDYVYNPAVVSADFDQTNEAAVELTEDAAYIKKQPIVLDKEVDNEDDYDVQVGDIVPFTVTVTVPQYNTNWTEPTFEVKDQLSNGLTLEVLPTIEGLTAGTDYTLTGAKGDKTFTIAFSENYLKNNASTAVEIKYSALVGEAVKETAQVHEETNTVTLKFSNDPTNKDSHKEITDETHHYTFAIDATRFGESSEKTTELLKVGVEKDGTPITKKVESAPMPTGVSPLAGAEFTLTGVGPNGTGTYTMTATTTDDGRMFFNNLEAGTYTLTETKAPAGYVKDSTEHTVVISAEYDDDGLLKSYTITIDGVATSTYTATTEGEEIKTIDKGANNESFLVNNKKGAELPSTGGIGTTIFYVAGIVMVLGAAAIVIARRKAEQE